MIDADDYKCLKKYRDMETGVYHILVFMSLIKRELISVPEPILSRDHITRSHVTYKGLWEMYLYENELC